MLLWAPFGALGAALAAPEADELAEEAGRGWYLWRTGQDAAAADLAAALLEAHPRSLPVRQLSAAMAVASGEGASLEVRTREWWGEEPDDPVRRVALAWAVTWRHAGEGSWCDEVSSLVGKVVEGEAHYWATLADRERERRCSGDTDHADAELARLQAAGGLGWADGVLAKIDAGYIKEDVPDALAEVLDREPWRVHRVAALWGDGVAGPGKAGARRSAKQALSAAEQSDVPLEVHAALRAHLAMGDERAAEAAAQRLSQLDPAADVALDRSEADLQDPPIYGQIDDCVRLANTPGESLTCLGSLEIPASGSIAAHAAYQRTLVAQAANDDEALLVAAREAHLADPSIRFHGRALARLVAGRAAGEGGVAAEDLELAIDAVGAALHGRVPSGGEIDPAGPTLPERVRPKVASDLDLRGRLLLAADRPEEALRDLVWARTLSPSPVRRLQVGLALAAVGRRDEAGLELAHGLAVEVRDTEAIRLARDALRPIAEGWVPDGVRGMIEAAKRAPGDDDAPPHPLLGRKLDDASLLPTPPEEPDPEAPRVEARVVVAYAAWAPGSVEVLSRVANLADKYGPKGVEVVALDVAAVEGGWPEGVDLADLEHRHVGPGAMRALRSVALPTVVVVDRRGQVVAGLSPYDQGTLDLEAALDELVPEG
jgi:tetratricopeptide (TPR) repeat protein